MYSKKKFFIPVRVTIKPGYEEGEAQSKNRFYVSGL